MKTFFLIALSCLGVGFIVWVAVDFVIAVIKAKRIGILRVKFPIVDKPWVVRLIFVSILALLTVWSLCLPVPYEETLNGLKTRGMAAFEEEHGYRPTFDSVEQEQAYLESEIARCEERYHDAYEKRRAQCLVYVLMVISNGVCILLQGVFITKAGLLPFGGSSKMLEFYAVADKEKIHIRLPDNEKTLFDLGASEENLRLLSEFIVDENVRQRKFRKCI